jgi:hypothetical protein
VDTCIASQQRSSHSGRKVIKAMGRTITTKASILATSIVVFGLCGSALAQTPKIVSTRIGTVPGGISVEVNVDGQTY